MKINRCAAKSCPGGARRRLGRAAGWVLAVGLGLAIGSILLCENAMRVPGRLRVAPGAALADAAARESGAVWEPAAIAASDGAVLRAWYFRPRAPNGAAVVLLHGVGDTRRGVLGHAALLLRAGYAVLAPDSRGHGESGGALVTFGLLEADDVSRWARWLEARGAVRLYGLGESLGAAILLQSLPLAPRMRAAVAEASYASFREIACDRVAGLRPIVEPAFVYARLRYGFDFDRASPLDALRHTRTPVLLIHGAADTNVLPRHARLLAAARPSVQLWEVPGGRHVSIFAQHPEEFRRRVLEWFAAH